MFSPNVHLLMPRVFWDESPFTDRRLHTELSSVTRESLYNIPTAGAVEFMGWENKSLCLVALFFCPLPQAEPVHLEEDERLTFAH